MSDFLDFLNRHEKIVLQFSAGKDSAACLKLLRPWIDKIWVLWMNPGSPYPETVEYMEKVKASVPHFQEIQGNQPRFVKEVGYPSDTMHFTDSDLGRAVSCNNGPKLVSTLDCCFNNLSYPLMLATKATGATGVVKGEKLADKLKSTLAQGTMLAGQQYWFPVHDWTDDQVVDFLGEDLPPSYRRGLSSSLDCANCTGFLDYNPGRLSDLRTACPSAYAEVVPIIHHMREQAARHLNNVEGLLRG